MAALNDYEKLSRETPKGVAALGSAMTDAMNQHVNEKRRKRTARQDSMQAVVDYAAKNPNVGLDAAGNKERIPIDTGAQMKKSFLRTPPQAMAKASPMDIGNTTGLAATQVPDPNPGISLVGSAQAADKPVDIPAGPTNQVTPNVAPDVDSPAGVNVSPLDNTQNNDSLMLSNKGIKEAYPGQLKAFQLNSEIDNQKGREVGSLASAGLARERNPDGSLQVGNMDVAFGPGTTKEQAAAFLSDPRSGGDGAPTWADMDKQFQNRQGLAEFGGRRPVQGGPLALLTAENSPNMGWKQRKSLNDINLKAYYANKLNTQDNQTDLAQTAMSGDIGLAKTRSAAEADLEQQRLKGLQAIEQVNAKAKAEGKADMPQPQWMPQKFDKKGRLIEGSGTWNIPETWNPEFGEGFNPNDSSTWGVADQGIMEMLAKAGKTSMLERIKQQYGTKK